MFRDRLDENAGMLFILGENNSGAFWMKNMKFPLDIIWISKDKTVVDIHRNAEPCLGNCPSMEPKAAASFVLEVNSGFVDKFGIKVGDKVRF